MQFYKQTILESKHKKRNEKKLTKVEEKKIPKDIQDSFITQLEEELEYEKNNNIDGADFVSNCL